VAWYCCRDRRHRENADIADAAPAINKARGAPMK
jgi:hypothetical protein